MTSAIVTHNVGQENGVHMRVAGAISEFASKYQGEIIIVNKENNYQANAKSILNLLLLEIKKGQTILIKVKGTNPIQTIDKIKKIVC
ncbi:HPr family phosphocarrier protein [Thalassotalea piscium]|uniref:Phosphotransferase system HPr (HPr) family protein n=1 Tax=Thalassotalea piscium TaxID=1230533 RepID=A0A7X0NK25_9GAMM|nr:HPr family phosphocarrier protein [Thalassotalea piscium]MBB6544746.1 phosphotransferase system HPr (HPr) family protein [Thalassotalea piscium]